jgi:hypothetical protein
MFEAKRLAGKRVLVLAEVVSLVYLTASELPSGGQGIHPPDQVI